MKINLFLILLGLGVFSSCYYDKAEKLYPSTTTADTNITYTSGAKTVFENNCVSCHATSSPSGGITLDNYADARVNTLSGSVLCCIQYTGACSNMPKSGKMSDANITAISNWKNKGCPQ
jgi:cytochrome c5